ncbi:16S rRNA processing protein RimM [Ligilactobacillus sp. WC1T17]|uniref:Ribosome maturation factor RimM n=1 Tax=Ligilactobacillus ruminis TaxID=1623 RepID=A0ABY1ABL9_9LACO|nr:16S rRNA processing protein RimM [Ligilactobacillus ruminis]
MDYYQVGKIVNTHGIKGEVRVLSSSDFTDERFKAGNTLYLFDKGTLKQEVVVKIHRKHKQFDLLTFEGLEDINAVEKFKGYDLKISQAQQAELEEGSYYYHQIIGLKVVTLEGAEVGTISEILAPGANDVWVVKQGQKEILLPVIDDVIKKVDLAKGEVIIDLLEGLAD